MPTYVYETLPEDGRPSKRFELFQRMSEQPLKKDPETGAKVRRVITGGVGVKLKGLKRSTKVDRSSPASSPCSCHSGHKHGHHGHTHRH